MSTRTLIVAFDSAEPQLVRQWAGEGLLPTLQRLLADGDSRDIENLPGFGNGVFWPCIYTGSDPSVHGGYYLRAPEPPDFALQPFDKHKYVRPPFWKKLAAEGRRVAIIDPVECPFAGLPDGVELIDWMVHRREHTPFSTPPSLIDDVIERYGDDPFEGNLDRTLKTGMKATELADVSDRRIRNKTDVALELLTQQDWDLFLVSYPDPHDIGHGAWHLHEQAAPGDTGIDDPLLRCYQRLDSALAELMHAVGPTAQTLVLMGPGMEANVTANALLPDVLRAFQGRRRGGVKRSIRRAARAIIEAEWIPWHLRTRFRDQRSRIGASVQVREGVRYFTVPHNDNAGAVRINLAGREQHGVVQPGGEYDAVCEDLARRLLGLRDAGGRLPAVSEVVRVHAHYDGPELDRLPDLLVIWNREADLQTIGSTDVGEFHNERVTHRSGDHSQRGLLLSDRSLEAAPRGTLDPMQVTPVLLCAVNRV